MSAQRRCDQGQQGDPDYYADEDQVEDGLDIGDDDDDNDDDDDDDDDDDEGRSSCW